MKRLLGIVFLLHIFLFPPAAVLAARDFIAYYEGDHDSMKIAITVDDLYEPVVLESILDLCLEYDVHITFFTLGIVITPENAHLWQRMVDEGHEIGNHTYGHKNILKLTSDQLGRQLRLTEDALNAALREPYTMSLFRPPFGEYDHRGYGSVMHLGAQGYPYLILWSEVLETVQRSFSRINGGDILLFHTNWKDLRCLEELIPKLLEAGFQPVTVSDLLNLPPMADPMSSE